MRIGRWTRGGHTHGHRSLRDRFRVTNLDPSGTGLANEAHWTGAVPHPMAEPHLLCQPQFR
jgi:hypothetical protein